MKTTNKTFSILTTLLLGCLTFSSCQNELKDNKTIMNKEQHQLIISDDNNEDDFCQLAGQMHNFLVESILDRISNEDIRILELSDRVMYDTIKQFTSHLTPFLL